MKLLRRSGLVIAGLLLAVLAVRVAAVLAFAPTQPQRAAALWPTHPGVQLSSGLTAIGASVAAGRAPPAELTAQLRGVARRDPLNPGPLLVEGTNAFAAGQTARAEQLLLAASRLDPLAPAPRFLLADLYFRQNKGEKGLDQVGFLFERLNGDAAPLVPALAQFAAQPGGAARVKSLLARQPETRDRVLALLADNPSNLPAILTIAPRSEPGQAIEWQQRLLAALIAKGEYARAFTLWQRFGNVAAGTSGVYNPRFLDGGAPPPFNWRINSGSAGTAEPHPGGGLHLLYFGREDNVLAEQVLLLKTGRYRLSFTTKGEPTGLLWALTCLPGTDRQEAPLSSGRLDFVIPASGCAAQRLELRGAMGDYPMTVDLVLSPVTLSGGRP